MSTTQRNHIAGIAAGTATNLLLTFRRIIRPTVGLLIGGTTGATNDPSFGMIYEPLMAQNRFDGTAPKPWLATSATWNSDFTSITFKLRTDVKWSDGQPFSADDVVYTFNLLQQYPALDTSWL